MRNPPFDRLTCPTCGEAFLPEAFRETGEDFIQQSEDIVHRQLHDAGPWYIVCDQGHKWTLKEWTRYGDRSDEVLLGVYLGDV